MVKKPRSRAELTDERKGIKMARHTDCEWTLLNVYDGDEHPIRVRGSNGCGQLGLYAEGHGGCHHIRPDAAPIVLLENRDGALYLLVWADYHDESPTHVIPLEGARILPTPKGADRDEDT